MPLGHSLDRDMRSSSSGYFKFPSGFRAAAVATLLAISAAADAGVEAGSPRDAGAADAGLACTPHRAVSCPCEGGLSGTMVCEPDGSGFGVCVCEEPPLTPIDPGGCKCTLGQRRTPAGAALAVLGGAMALAFQRRLSRARRRGAA